jgi:lipid II:glycine glycyltransferase (peptidoglycan interpeptide bridge formation enzyme)
MTSVVFEELRSLERFHPESLMAHAPLTQSYTYGEWQRAVGRTVRRFAAFREGKCIAALQLVQFPLVAGRHYWYAPYGPVLRDAGDGEAVRGVFDLLHRKVSGTKAVFARVDFSPSLRGDALKSAEALFRKAPCATQHISSAQPRAEWALNLTQSEEEIMRGMHHNTRYSIRAAVRRGVQVEIVGASFLPEQLEGFYGLMQETAARDGFSLHPKRYYEAAFRISAEVGNAFLVLARHEGALLAAHFIVLFGGQANFVFGGSSSAHRDLFGSYAAQWAALREAKARGATRYNFGGVSGEGEAREGWEGLSSFKRKFGGEFLVHSPFFDVVGSKFWYYAYVIRKVIRNW